MKTGQQASSIDPATQIPTVDDRTLLGRAYCSLYAKDKETEGVTMELIDAGDGVSRKTPRGRQQETTSLDIPT